MVIMCGRAGAGRGGVGIMQHLPHMVTLLSDSAHCEPHVPACATRAMHNSCSLPLKTHER